MRPTLPNRNRLAVCWLVFFMATDAVARAGSGYDPDSRREPPLPARAGERALPCAEAEVRVDLLELNHCYDTDGRHKFDQLIVWEWSPDYCRYHVVGWWIPSDPLTEVLDGRTARHNGRRYRATLLRETWTVGWDPEVENRKLYPCGLRRGL